MICAITDEKTHFHSDALNLQTGTIIQGHNNTKNATNKKRKKKNNQMLCFAIKELFLHSPCQAVAGLSSLEASQFACRCQPPQSPQNSPDIEKSKTPYIIVQL